MTPIGKEKEKRACNVGEEQREDWAERQEVRTLSALVLRLWMTSCLSEERGINGVNGCFDDRDDFLFLMAVCVPDVPE